MRGLETASEGIHATDMGVEQVDRLETLATALGVEIQSAAGETAHPKNAQHDLRRQVDVRRELVRVPPYQLITRIRVDGTEGVGGHGDFEFVHHGVTGESGVVGLDIELQLTHEIVLAEEVQTGRRVRVILVRRGFAWLRLDEEIAGEADLFLVGDSHFQERGKMVQFTRDIGIVESRVTLATTPEHVTFAAEAVGHFEGLFHLGSAVGKHVGKG